VAIHALRAAADGRAVRGGFEGGEGLAVGRASGVGFDDFDLGRAVSALEPVQCDAGHQARASGAGIRNSAEANVAGSGGDGEERVLAVESVLAGKGSGDGEDVLEILYAFYLVVRPVDESGTDRTVGVDADTTEGSKDGNLFTAQTRRQSAWVQSSLVETTVASSRKNVGDLGPLGGKIACSSQTTIRKKSQGHGRAVA